MSLRLTAPCEGYLDLATCDPAAAESTWMPRGRSRCDDRGDLLDLVHHARELVGIDGLRAVGEGLFRLVVHLDEDAVCANRNCGARHGQNLVALAGAVAGVDEDGQVAELLYGGNDAEVEGVARVIGKGAHAALAEDDFVVALAHDVFGGHQEFVERGAHAAFQQHGHAQAAGVLEQRKVLHVAGADLDDVGPLGNELERFVVDGFGDDAQSEAVANFGHDLEGFDAEALECVRRGARLVGAAAEELRAGCGDLFGDGKGLLAALDGAWAGDNGEIAAADGGVGSGEADDGVFFFYVAAGELVGLGDTNDFGDAGHLFEVAAVDFALVAGDSDGGALGAGHRVRAVTHELQYGRRRPEFASAVACAFMTTNITGSSTFQVYGNSQGFCAPGFWAVATVAPANFSVPGVICARHCVFRLRHLRPSQAR